MKNFSKTFGIIALAAVIGFSMTALSLTGCGGGDDGGVIIDDPVNGTYKAADGEQIRLNNGSFEISNNNKPSAKGTYTTSARSVSVNIALAVKDIHGDFLKENMDDPEIDITFQSKWYNKTQLIDEFKKWMQEEYPSLTDPQISEALENMSDDFDNMFPTMDGTIDGDAMIVDGTTYNKESSTPSGGGGGWTPIDMKNIFSFQDDSGFHGHVYYCNNKFFIVSGGKISTSSNGVNWSAAVESPFSYMFDAIAYGNGKYIAVHGRDFSSSTDGTTWTDIVSLPGFDDMFTKSKAIAYGNGKFVVVGGNIAHSSDGNNWTSVADNTGGGFYAIAYGNGKFVTVGGKGKIAYSSNGETWTVVTDTTIWDYVEEYSGTTYNYTADINAIIYANNKFFAVGAESKMATSTDGVNWTPVSLSAFTNEYGRALAINAIAYGNGKFVAGGVGSGLGGATIATSTDGTTWTAVDGDKLFSIFTESITTIAYGNGTFVAASLYGNKIGIAYWKP